MKNELENAEDSWWTSGTILWAEKHLFLVLEQSDQSHEKSWKANTLD